MGMMTMDLSGNSQLWRFEDFYLGLKFLHTPHLIVFCDQLFDRETVEAVLQEWYKSIKDLPSGFRRAVELVCISLFSLMIYVDFIRFVFLQGLMSSAQLVRFISIDARPTIARTLSRLAPSDLSREFIGRSVQSKKN